MTDQPLAAGSTVRDLLTVVIPTRNRPALLTSCLRSVFERQTPRPRVIVSDNSYPSSADIELFTAWYGFEYVRQSGELSIAQHFNACLGWLARVGSCYFMTMTNSIQNVSRNWNRISSSTRSRHHCGRRGTYGRRRQYLLGRWVHANPGIHRGEAAVLALGLGLNRNGYAPSTLLGASEARRLGGYGTSRDLPLPADSTLDLSLAYLHGVAFLPEIIGRYREGHIQESQISTPDKIHAWLGFMVGMLNRVGESGCPERAIRKAGRLLGLVFLAVEGGRIVETDRTFVFDLCDRCLRLSPEPGEWQRLVRREYPFLFWRPRWCAWPLFRVYRKVAYLSGRDVQAWYSLE